MPKNWASVVDNFRKTERGYTHGLKLDLCSLVAQALSKKGWSQKKLAEKAGMKESYISDVLNNKRNWTAESASKILFALGVKPRLLEDQRPPVSASHAIDEISIKSQGKTNAKESQESRQEKGLKEESGEEEVFVIAEATG